jgi:hypothetical protein
MSVSPLSLSLSQISLASTLSRWDESGNTVGSAPLLRLSLCLCSLYSLRKTLRLCLLSATPAQMSQEEKEPLSEAPEDATTPKVAENAGDVGWALLPIESEGRTFTPPLTSSSLSCARQCVKELHCAQDPDVTPYRSKYKARVILVSPTPTEAGDVSRPSFTPFTAAPTPPLTDLLPPLCLCSNALSRSIGLVFSLFLLRPLPPPPPPPPLSRSSSRAWIIGWGSTSSRLRSRQRVRS